MRSSALSGTRYLGSHWHRSFLPSLDGLSDVVAINEGTPLHHRLWRLDGTGRYPYKVGNLGSLNFIQQSELPYSSQTGAAHVSTHFACVRSRAVIARHVM